MIREQGGLASDGAAPTLLAVPLGATIRTVSVSADCTALSVCLEPDHLQRLQAALLLGGATIMSVDGLPPAATILLTITARAR